MYTLLMVILMIGITLGAMPVKTQETVYSEHSAKVMARNVMEYRLAAQRWIEVNPTVAGIIPDNDLPLPPYYNKMGGYIFYANGGDGWVVVPVIAPDIEYHLTEILSNGLYTPVMGTVTSAGQVRSALWGVVPAVVPNGIPTGAFVTGVRSN